VFAPPHRDEFYEIIGRRYREAVAEATRIATAKDIEMRVEFFKPVHFGWTSYKLPVGDTQKTLKSNVAIFFNGFAFLDDSGFDYMQWWFGAKTIWVGEWFVKPVYYYQEKQGMYKGNLDKYGWKGDETFAFKVNSTTTPTPSEVNAWLHAFVVIPKSMAEIRITTA